MATITFRAKPETIHNVDGSVAYVRIKVPMLTRNHCDMHAFRTHSKFGNYANSDLFPSMLAKIKREVLGDYIRMDYTLPSGVTVDTSGFLALVTIEV